MWLFRVLTMKAQLEQLDQQMDKLRLLIEDKSPKTRGSR